MELELSSRTTNQDQSFTWEDIWFIHLNKFANAMSSGDLDSYRLNLQTMESLLSHKIDGEYEDNKACLNIDYKVNKDISEVNYYEQLGQELIKLMGRATSKKEDLTEHIDSSTILKNIVSQLKNGIGQNLMITGKMGSGKSWASLRFAEEVANQTGGKFSAEHVVSTLEDFMTLYNDKDLCPPGSVIIFEEVGVNVNSKKAMSKINIAFADVFQTSRYRELLLILNAPAVSFLDKTPRSLLHWWLQTDRLNKIRGYCEIKPHMVELDQIRGELLFPYPRYKDNQRITRLNIGIPSKTLREEYEKTSRAYKDKVGKDSLYSISNNGFDYLETQYIQMRKEGKTQKEVLKELGKSICWGVRIEKQAKSKGLGLPEMRGKALENSGNSLSS